VGAGDQRELELAGAGEIRTAIRDPTLIGEDRVLGSDGINKREQAAERSPEEHKFFHFHNSFGQWVESTFESLPELVALALNQKPRRREICLAAAAMTIKNK
jgi:hypothetical protein